jgi:putative salt-induced outer membrane protein
VALQRDPLRAFACAMFNEKDRSMRQVFSVSGASMIALLIGAGLGQAQTNLTGIRGVNDRIDDLQRDAQRELDRAEDENRFGNPEARQGLSGSASFGFSGTSGAVDSQDIDLGARLRFANGRLVQTIGMVLEFSEAGGVKTDEDVFGVYDANYYFTDQFYGFALGRVATDGLAATAGDVKTDAFFGVGPGYRIVNTDNVAWRVQAGVGISHLKDGVDDDTTEVGYIASSRVFYKFNDTLFATNDTDILKSDSALRINNDLGVNFQFTDAFATRISYLTDYNDSRAQRSENKLGVALVYGF